MHGARLLLVDDDSEMRSWLAAALVRQGAIIEQAASGWESLSLLADRHYDLVVTDVRRRRRTACACSAARAPSGS
jgi:DNA-binding response OmpR family regulator